MVKYVDVDPLLYKLPEDLPYKGAVRRVLIMAPAADVRPVVRAKWAVDDCVTWVGVDVTKPDAQPKKFKRHICPACGFYTGTQADDWNYCPICGAYMREE